MALTVGKVGKAAANGNSTITTTWTGGGSSAASSNLVAFYSSANQTGTLPTTPAGWTRLTSNADTHGTSALYYILNASAVTGLVLTVPMDDAMSLDIAEIQGASTSAIDSSTTYATGNGTTETTNGITTVATNAIVLAFFAARSSTTTPRTLNTPGTGFTQLQTNNQSPGASISTTSYGTYEIFSSTQSALTTTCAVTSSANWQCVSIAFAQAAAASWQPYTRNERFDSLIEQANFAYESRRAMIVLPTSTTPSTWIPLSRKGSWEDIPDDWDD